jgi:hypothetical protein
MKKSTMSAKIALLETISNPTNEKLANLATGLFVNVVKTWGPAIALAKVTSESEQNNRQLNAGFV